MRASLRRFSARLATGHEAEHRRAPSRSEGERRLSPRRAAHAALLAPTQARMHA
jgi:hypothetical protein